MTLPTNVDATYADRSPADALHQQHHDEIHGFVNGHPVATDPHPGQYLTPAAASAAYVEKAGGSTIDPPAGVKGLVVKGTTVNALEVQNSSGAVLVQVEPSGTIRSGNRISAGTLTHIGGIMQVQSTGAAEQGLVVRGAASQTANLAEFQNSAGTVLSGVRSDGRLAFNAVDRFTIGTYAGSLFVNVAGSNYFIPLYS